MTLDNHAFRYVQQLVRERSAIVLEEGKQYLVETRLSELARREQYASAQDVVDRLRAAPQGPLQRKVIEAMTTTETLWFRDIKPYDMLRTTLIPDMKARRASERELVIWSCACSSGQEPYSLAMLIRESFPELATWKIRIIATDISTEMLERTRTGAYNQLEVNRGLPVGYLTKYFIRDGLRWRVKPELQQMLELRQLNLASAQNMLPRADIVLLRNVLIYFDLETRKQIYARVRAAMRRDGALLLGTAESTANDDGFDAVRVAGTTYYRPRQA
nr:protein-glutamate O-methyltransferase CheR [Kofleriaceae bacterium]